MNLRPVRRAGGCCRSPSPNLEGSRASPGRTSRGQGVPEGGVPQLPLFPSPFLDPSFPQDSLFPGSILLPVSSWRIPLNKLEVAVGGVGTPCSLVSLHSDIG